MGVALILGIPENRGCGAKTGPPGATVVMVAERELDKNHPVPTDNAPPLAALAAVASWVGSAWVPGD